MKNVATLIRKDLLFYLKDPKSLFILFLLPLLLLIISILIFSSEDPQILLGVCNPNGSQEIVGSYTEMVETFDASTTVINDSCGNLQRMLNQGELAIYMVVEEKPGLGMNTTVTLRVDDTNAMLSREVKSHIQNMLDRYIASQSTSFINESWSALEKMSIQLSTRVESFSLGSIDTSLGDLSGQLSMVNDISVFLERAEGDLSKAQQDLKKYNDDIAQSIDDIEDMQEDLADTEEKLYRLSITVDNVHSTLNCDQVDTPECDDIEDVQEDIEEERRKIQEVQKTLETTKQDLQVAQRDINDARRDIIALKNDVRDGQVRTDNAKVELRGTQDKIERSNEKIDAVVEDAQMMKNRVQDIANKTASAQEVIQTITTYEASDIISPLEVRLDDQPFTLDENQTLLPGVIVILSYFSMILLTSVSVISEKNKGLVRAIYNTGTSVHEYLGTKIVSSMFLFILQVIIILVSANLIFGLNIPLSLSLVVFFAMFLGLVFASTGTLVGLLSTSIQGSVFVSLLLILPFLLLQGLFVPRQVMMPVIQDFVLIVPSYAAHQLARSVFFLQDISLYSVIVLLIFGSVCYVASYVVSNKKVTLD